MSVNVQLHNTVVTCNLDIVIGAYLYTLPVTAEVEWLHTIYSDHVNESYIE